MHSAPSCKLTEFGDIPNRWLMVTLDQVATKEPNSFVAGPFGSDLKVSDYTSTGVRLIQLQNVSEGRFDPSNEKYTSEKKFEQLKKCAAYPGDILVAKMADPLARACIAPHLCDRYLLVADVIRIHVDTQKFDPSYVMYAVNSEGVRRQALAQSTGTTRQRITLSALRKVKLPQPPLKEQQWIGAILDNAQKLRLKRDAVNHLTSNIIQSFFLKLFGDPVSNENRWPVKTVREVAEKVSDGPFGSNLKTEHYTAHGIRVVRLQNIGVGEFLDDDKVFVSLEHYSKLKKHTCIPGDVVVGTLGEPNLRACILPVHVKVAINKADCIQVRPSRQFLNAAYLCHLLNTPQMLRFASSYIHGETRTRISMSQVASLPIPIPPLSVQEKFAQILNGFDHLNRNQKQSSDVIDELFHSLMHKAFRGGLAVPKITA